MNSGDDQNSYYGKSYHITASQASPVSATDTTTNNNNNKMSATTTTSSTVPPGVGSFSSVSLNAAPPPPNNHNYEVYDKRSPTHQSSLHHSGVTQTIRSKLNFNDESRWKKFSARRLELIDGLHLSSRKASEQDEQIANVADKLRLEYGFSQDTLNDFDKLVRAGIQSVRRNRKRQPKSKPAHYEETVLANKRVRSLSSSQEAESSSSPNSRPTVAGAMPAPTRQGLPSMMNSSIPLDDHFRLVGFLTACRHMNALISKCGQPLPPMGPGNTLPKASQNLDFLGDSLLRAGVAVAIERRYPTPAVSDRVGEITSALLSDTISRTLALTQNLNSPLEMKLLIGGSSRSFGFDATITAISNVFFELMGISSSVDLTSPEELLTLFPKSLVNVKTSTVEPLPLLRQVSLNFNDRRIDMTYSPIANTPPNLSELIDNAKTAFQIMSEQYVEVQCMDSGRVLKSDHDVEQLFNGSARINLTFVVPSSTTTFQQLPSLSYLSQTRYQELL